MKKQLSILAGSVLLASSANAAITPANIDTSFGGVSTGSSAILVLLSGAGSYVFDTGISADDLSSGTGFSLDVSSALGDLGSIDHYAVIGITSGVTSFDYDPGVYDYVDAGLGVVYAGSAAGTVTPNGSNLNTYLNNLANYITTVQAGGFFANGLAGDFDEEPNVLGTQIIASGLTGSVFWQQSGPSRGAAPTQGEVTITAPLGLEGVNLTGTQFTVEAAGTVIPVPAAAWLFGSALVGLGVVRRK